MVNLPLTTTILKMTALGLSFLTMCLTAAYISLYKQYDFGMYITNSMFTGVSSTLMAHVPTFAGAVIAAQVFNILYFSYYFVFLFWRPASIFISMIVDISWLGFLFLFNIGAIGSMSANSAYFANCNTAGGHCQVGRAACAFGWFVIFIILGLVTLQTAWTIKFHGMDIDTWRTPFNELLMSGAAAGAGAKFSSRGGSTTGVEGKMEGGEASMPAFETHQQHFQPTRGYAPVPTNQQHANV